MTPKKHLPDTTGLKHTRTHRDHNAVPGLHKFWRTPSTGKGRGTRPGTGKGRGTRLLKLFADDPCWRGKVRAEPLGIGHTPGGQCRATVCRSHSRWAVQSHWVSVTPQAGLSSGAEGTNEEQYQAFPCGFCFVVMGWCFLSS